MKSFKILPITVLAALFLALSCNKEDTQDDPSPGQFSLQFTHNFNDAPLEFNKDYVNSSGETVSFTKLRYYISNIRLEREDGSFWTEAESYHLIDFENETSHILNLSNVPAGKYQSISYMIGVDSVRNISGAQEGALSIANNMFWSWNNGYIFFKIEGRSPVSSNNAFAYHVGGFSGPDNALTTNIHEFGSQMLNINVDQKAQLQMAVDLEKVFDGKYKISVATLSGIHMPGTMAQHMAQNFQSAFSVTIVQ